MRRLVRQPTCRTVAAAVTCATFAILLTACNDDNGGNSSLDKTITTAAAGSSTRTAATTPAATATAKATTTSPKPADKAVAHVGATLTVHGFENSRLSVTLVKWLPIARSSDEFIQAAPGKVYAAAQIRITNTSTRVYSDSPSNGVQAADSQGQHFRESFGEVTAGPSMASSVNLKPGDVALGWVVFEVPSASKIIQVQFAMNSGFADEVAEWQIP